MNIKTKSYTKVDIAEAMEAYTEGKTIKSVVSGTKYSRTGSFSASCSIGRASKLELRGKWVVEESK